MRLIRADLMSNDLKEIPAPHERKAYMLSL